MIILAIVGSLIIFGGGYFVYAYFRVGHILSNDRLLNQAISNTETAGGSIDPAALDKGEAGAVRQEAQLLSTDTETVKTSVQFSHINYLISLLADYHQLYGSYPSSLADLQTKEAGIVEICRTHSGCDSKKISSPVSTNYIYDTFTSAVYPYERTSTGLRLTYTMGHCKTKGMCQYFASFYRQGKNTMTENDYSLEKQDPSDNSNIAQSSTVTLSSVDTDGDGLTDAEETTTYHTNPNLRDTDGDGFSDGEEVKNGYNPNGPGKLVNPTP